MAKPILATDFKDDIMQEDMNGKRKYRMVNNSDGTVSFEDVTDYQQVGSSYGAGQINTTNEAVNQSFDKNKLIRDLDTINALTEEGYAPDALAVKVLNSSLNNISGMFVNTSANNIATITTANSSWTATEDCYCIALLGASSSTEQAAVMLDDFPMIITNAATSGSVTFTNGGGFYVKKGQVVRTKNGSHKYQVTFKPLF